jgi:hypothetical protein
MSQFDPTRTLSTKGIAIVTLGIIAGKITALNATRLVPVGRLRVPLSWMGVRPAKNSASVQTLIQEGLEFPLTNRPKAARRIRKVGRS